ncbi:MAG: hypothetical protein M3394_06700 [Actinomycetota bacterium]|nr:hypothetical protein [Actinomycetota bacterium]
MPSTGALSRCPAIDPNVPASPNGSTWPSLVVTQYPVVRPWADATISATRRRTSGRRSYSLSPGQLVALVSRWPARLGYESPELTLMPWRSAFHASIACKAFMAAPVGSWPVNVPKRATPTEPVLAPSAWAPITPRPWVSSPVGTSPAAYEREKRPS